VEGLLDAYRLLQPGQKLGPDPFISGKDINGYFEFSKSQPMRLMSASVEVSPGGVRARVVRSLGSLNIMAYRLAPRWSMDWDLAIEGGRPVVRGGRLGHLPMIGPGRLILSARLKALWASQKDWSSLAHVKQVTIQGTGVGLVVQP
jgi:hypothetical protein